MRRNTMNLALLFLILGISVSCRTPQRESLESEDTIEDAVDNSDIPNDYIVNDTHYHYTESRDDFLYVIYQRDVSWDDNSFGMSLWRFSPYNTALLIAEGSSIDFRVSPDNELIAVYNGEDLRLYGSTGETLHVFDPDSIIYDIEMREPYSPSDLSLELEGWNLYSNKLWCSLKWTYVTHAFIVIETDTWESTVLNDLVFDSKEYSLNTSTGCVVYSDYPVCFCPEERELYQSSEEQTTLYICDLFTGMETAIDSAETNLFEPRWGQCDYNSNTIFYRVNGSGRSYDLNTN